MTLELPVRPSAAPEQTPLSSVPRPAGARIGMALLAWTAMLVASDLPTIAWRQATHALVPLWLVGAQEGIVVALLVLAWLIPAWRPLWRYLLTLAIFAAFFHINGLLISSGAFIALLRVPASGWQYELAVETLPTLATVLLALTLLGSGVRRRDLFLTRGDPRAVIRKNWLFLNYRDRRWLRMLPWYAVPLALLLFFGMYRHTPLPPDALHRWLFALPIILPIAALNTFNEEFQERQAPLAWLRPALGDRQSLALTALLFGIGHFYGNPSGYVGVMAAAWWGYLQARSMLDTKGSTWAYCMHLIQDVIIFSFLIIGLSAGG